MDKYFNATYDLPQRERILSQLSIGWDFYDHLVTHTIVPHDDNAYFALNGRSFVIEAKNKNLDYLMCDCLFSENVLRIFRPLSI